MIDSLPQSSKSIFVLSHERSIRRRHWIYLIVALLITMGALAALLRQSSCLSNGFGGDSPNNLYITVPQGVSKSKGSSSIGFACTRANRGIYTVEEFVITPWWSKEDRAWVRGFLDAKSTVRFNGEIPGPLRGIASSVEGYHPERRYRFIGSVSLRREILWTFFGLGIAGILWFTWLVYQSHRRLRRVRCSLCPKCVYPMQEGKNLVVCSECGILIERDQRSLLDPQNTRREKTPPIDPACRRVWRKHSAWRKRRKFAVAAALCLLFGALAVAILSSHTMIMRGKLDYVGPYVEMRNANGTNRYWFTIFSRREYHGLLVVERFYKFQLYDEPTSKLHDYALARDDIIEFLSGSERLRGLQPKLLVPRDTDQTTFTGLVSLRSEVLWALIGLSLTGTALFYRLMMRSHRQLQRARQKLCLMCIPPTQEADATPEQCRECGILIERDQRS